MNLFVASQNTKLITSAFEETGFLLSSYCFSRPSVVTPSDAQRDLSRVLVLLLGVVDDVGAVLEDSVVEEVGPGSTKKSRRALFDICVLRFADGIWPEGPEATFLRKTLCGPSRV